MQPNDSSHTHSLGNNWHILGELELPVGASTDNALQSWLTELLDPLNLHADFLNQVLKSAQEVAVRVLNAETAMKFEHIHILVLVTSDHISKGGTWGFFRIEKIENTAEGDVAHGHTIGFYLYVEGE